MISLDIPTELCYNIPGRFYTVNFDDDLYHYGNKQTEGIVYKYNSLVNWCMIQCYWYYCIGEPKVDNDLYETVIEFLTDCETNIPGDIDDRWSPTRRDSRGRTRVGQWKSNPTHYPRFVQDMFADVEHHPRLQHVSKVSCVPAKPKQEIPKPNSLQQLNFF